MKHIASDLATSLREHGNTCCAPKLRGEDRRIVARYTRRVGKELDRKFFAEELAVDHNPMQEMMSGELIVSAHARGGDLFFVRK